MKNEIAIIGCGRIGSVHARAITETLPMVDLVCADVEPRRATDLANRVGVHAVDIADVWDRPNLRAVAICSSTTTHVDYICAAAEAGVAVFCEKPVSLDLDEVDRAVRAVTDSDIPFMVGFHKRFDPTHQATKKAVVDGRVGDVHLLRITTRDPQPPPLDYIAVSGGIFLDMTIHDFDMARFLVDSPVQEIFARGAALIDPQIEQAGDFDTAVVWMRHESGAMTVIDNSRQAAYGHDQRVEVFGSEGMVTSENHHDHTAVVLDAEGSHGAVVPHHFLERYESAYRHEWTAFWSYLNDGGPSPVSIEDGRAPVALAVAAGESARTRTPIALRGVR